MPPQEEAFRNDQVVLWLYTGVDNFNQPVRGEPEEIYVRWHAKDATANASAGGPDGSIQAVEETREAWVLTDRVISTGSLMWLGSLDDWNGAGSGSISDPDEIYEVKDYEVRKDLKGRVSRRELRCLRFRGTLPDREVVGQAARVNLTITGTGFSNSSCSDCGLLNVSIGATLRTNMLRYQEWTSNQIAGGGGVGLCAGNWKWTVKRYLDRNRVEAIVSRVNGSSVTNQVTWAREGVAWNGVASLALNLVSGGSVACSWPATLTIQGV